MPVKEGSTRFVHPERSWPFAPSKGLPHGTLRRWSLAHVHHQRGKAAVHTQRTQRSVPTRKTPQDRTHMIEENKGF